MNNRRLAIEHMRGDCRPHVSFGTYEYNAINMRYSDWITVQYALCCTLTVTAGMFQNSKWDVKKLGRDTECALSTLILKHQKYRRSLFLLTMEKCLKSPKGLIHVLSKNNLAQSLVSFSLYFLNYQRALHTHIPKRCDVQLGKFLYWFTVGDKRVDWQSRLDSISICCPVYLQNVYLHHETQDAHCCSNQAAARQHRFHCLTDTCSPVCLLVLFVK